jgi:hypothetical protein
MGCRWFKRGEPIYVLLSDEETNHTAILALSDSDSDSDVVGYFIRTMDVPNSLA